VAPEDLPYVEGNASQQDGLCQFCAEDIVEQVEGRKRREASDEE